LPSTLFRIASSVCLALLPALAAPPHKIPALPGHGSPAALSARAGASARDTLPDHLPERALRLGQDWAEWRRTADSLRARGYRPLSLDAEGTAADPALATVWTRSPGPDWALAGPAAGPALVAALAHWDAKGYRPFAIAALPAPDSASGPASFAVLVAKDGRAAEARFDLDQDGFQAACDSARKARAKCDWIEVYGEAAHPLFAAVFARDSAATPWNYSLGDDAASLKTKQEIFGRVWVRPARVAPMPGGRFATVWEENSAGAWEFLPDADAATASAAAARATGPRAAEARPWPGASGHYAVLACGHDAPLPKAWTVTGPEAPGLEAFDGYMRDLMRSRGVRAGALAIARDGRLAFAHGYTWGEPGYPVTRPNSLFRAASCSKPLTSILVHKMLREGGGRAEGPSLKEKILSVLHAGREAPDAPADPRFGEITVDELLTHSAGWVRSRSNPDPVFNDYPPGSEIRKRLPSDRKGFLSYMLRQPLQFPPGSKSVYDNFGYFLLGRMLESLPMGVGKTYKDIAEDLLFKPLGLSRPRFGGSRYEERAPGEVLYHTAVPYLQANPAPDGPPWVAGGYGDFEVGNMDAAGAWLLSAPDYAKVLAAFDLGAGNPILGPQATATMWGPAGFGEALRGWFALKVPAANGDTALAKWHNGLFPGTSTLVFYHPDRWSFVMFLDRDLSPQPDGPHEGRDLARLAAAVKEWPQADLFPAMGIPSFRQPSIGPERMQADAGAEDASASDPGALAGDPK
jgi:CubicO group peptidase (beta-lactamase class C family)